MSEGVKTRAALAAGDEGNLKQVITELKCEVINAIKSEMIELIKNEVTNVIKNEVSSLRDDFKKLGDNMQSQINAVGEKSDHALKQIKDLQTEINVLKDELSSMQKKEMKIKNKLDQMSAKMVAMDSYSRRENLIIHGISKTENEDCAAKVKQFLTQQLKIPDDKVEAMRFQRCHRLSSREQNSVPMICRFMWAQDRQLVWGARKNLKNTSFSLNEDFSPEINETRRIMMPIMKAARSANKKSHLIGDKLVIDGKTYTKQTLDTLPEALDPAKLATKHFNGVVAYYSSASPLSNFFSCPQLTIDRKQYDHVEQFYQMQKALYAEKPKVAQIIQNTTNPYECKRLGDAIKVNENAWLPQAKQVLLKACTAKFDQIEYAKDYLIATKDKSIAEATKDVVWGVGLQLHDPKLPEKKNWLGQNVMGHILETVRDNIIQMQ